MAIPSGYTNITLVAPNGTSQHNRVDFLCVPARWITVVKFFMTYFVAHAFTICPRPGEKFGDVLFASILALLFPVSALDRGIDAIYRNAIWHTGCLKGVIGRGEPPWKLATAIRAGAIGIVVRENGYTNTTLAKEKKRLRFDRNKYGWDKAGAYVVGKVHEADDVNGCPAYHIKMPEGTEASDYDFLKERNIAGVVSKREKKLGGYLVEEFPYAAMNFVHQEIGSDDRTLEIPQSSNLFRAFVAFLQVLYASFQLTRQVADQFQVYGYSAYPWTIFPYLLMSLLNLIGNLCTPAYPNIYLVRNAALGEAESRGFQFEGSVVARLADNDQSGEYKIFVKSDNTIEPPGTMQPLRKLCFRNHKEQHVRTISVSEGRPIVSPKTVKRHETKTKCVLMLVSIFITLIPFIVSKSRGHPSPDTWPEKIAFPLWIGIGDCIGLYLLWFRVRINVMGDLAILFHKSQQVKDKKAKQSYLRVFLVSLQSIGVMIVGAGVVIWNFQIVATQILEFGDCKKLSVW